MKNNTQDKEPDISILLYCLFFTECCFFMCKLLFQKVIYITLIFFVLFSQITLSRVQFMPSKMG